jgi:hypothetical protein
MGAPCKSRAPGIAQSPPERSLVASLDSCSNLLFPYLGDQMAQPIGAKEGTQDGPEQNRAKQADCYRRLRQAGNLSGKVHIT